ncbi:MAG TPA: 2-C-methyl-D-erythritol 4-phosphate cytidylyltransferase [Tepidisphaeraceae bacterium]|nr:2-C-methyl-D-erythritol 4-phosphate cytidylyltransferase [Tepidisphaeraceae bacterium]
MATYSVLLLTAPPPTQNAEAGGAFVKIDGRESLLRSVELFLNRDHIKQIQVCFLPADMEEAKRKYAPHLSFSGVKVMTGGPRWIDQIVAAADKIASECTHVLIHDAARPAVPYSDIEALMEAAEKHPAVVLAAPSRTALVEVDEGGNALAIHPAAQYMNLLTPQVYSRKKFEEMAQSKQELHASQLHLIKGSPLNLRIGAPSDANLLKAMLSLLPKPKLKGPLSPFEEAQW